MSEELTTYIEELQANWRLRVPSDKRTQLYLEWKDRHRQPSMQDVLHAVKASFRSSFGGVVMDSIQLFGISARDQGDQDELVTSPHDLSSPPLRDESLSSTTLLGRSPSELGRHSSQVVIEKHYCPPDLVSHMRSDVVGVAIPGVNIEINLNSSVALLQQKLADNMLPQRGLTEDEMLALVIYTYTDEQPQEMQLYFAYNNLMRSRNNERLEALKPFTASLLRGMMKLPSVNGSVYRGIPIKDQEQFMFVINSYQHGTKVHWLALTSTSTSRQEAISKANKFNFGGFIFHCSISDGRIIQEFSHFPPENEVLLPMDCEFIVSSNWYVDRDGYWHIDLTQPGRSTTFY
jgi:hypothetical protein